MATMNDTVGARIRRRRLARGLRLDDLASRVDSNISTLSRIETGKRSPTFDELQAIATALACPLRSLVPQNPLKR